MRRTAKSDTRGREFQSIYAVANGHAIVGAPPSFGAENQSLNNMVRSLRRFPVYGGGDYPVQPVYAQDLEVQAMAYVSQGKNLANAGPEPFSFEALLRLLASAMGLRARNLHTPPSVASP